MRIIILLVLAIVEGFLLSLSIPNVEIGLLPFISFLPTFFIIRYTKTYKGAFFIGWVVGIFGLLFGFNWLIYTVDTFGGASFSNVMAFFVFLLYCIFFSLKFPVMHLLLKLADKNLSRISLLIVFPVLLTATEFLIPEIFPYFFGNLMHKDVLAMQIVEVTGMPGMSFLMGLSNALIFVILSFFFPEFTKSEKKDDFPFLGVSIALVVFLAVHLFGFFRIQNIEYIEKNIEEVKVGFVQPNTPLLREHFVNEFERIKPSDFNKIRRKLKYDEENKDILNYYTYFIDKNSETGLPNKINGKIFENYLLKALKSNQDKKTVVMSYVKNPDTQNYILRPDLNKEQINKTKKIFKSMGYILTRVVSQEKKEEMLKSFYSVEYYPQYPDKKPHENQYRYSQDKCLELSEELLKNHKDIDLVVWPEGGAHFFSRENDKIMKKVREMVKKYDVPMYVNNFYMNEEKKLFNNSDLVVPPDGKIADYYRKIYLLAFGEYNPFKGTIIEKLFPDLIKMMDASAMFESAQGTEIKTLTFEKDGKKLSFAPQICYEIIIPQFTRRFTSQGANFIVNATLDRWFGYTKASSQHMLLGSARAIENRMYLVRSTATGISAVIDPIGRYEPFYSKKDGEGTLQTRLYDSDYGVVSIKPLDVDTFYKSYGDVFGWIVSVIGIIGVILSLVFAFLNRDVKPNNVDRSSPVIKGLR